MSYTLSDIETYFSSNLLGGKDSLTDSRSVSKGVFSHFPAATPKYRAFENEKETLARLYVVVPSSLRDRYIRALPQDARPLAEAIYTSGRNTSETEGLGYIDFLLQSVTSNNNEKVSISEVLSDNYAAFFFGASPPTLTCGGTLINTVQDDWKTAFEIVYQEIIRGTKLARRKQLVTLSYDTVSVTGTIVNMTTTLTAIQQMVSSFSFSMLVKRYEIYRLPGTQPTVPAPFPTYRPDPRGPGNMYLGRITKNKRFIGEPFYSSSSRSKKSNLTPEEKMETALKADIDKDVKVKDLKKDDLYLKKNLQDIKDMPAAHVN